ncbi:MAG: hypothetical protein ACPF83_02175 [Flavobacteriales bacterium]
MNRFKLAFIALLGAIVLAGCQENTEFENPVYTCECGSVSWNGAAYDFLMAEYLHQPDTNLLSRRYYTTTNVAVEGETEPHHLNISFYVEDVTGQFFTAEDDSLAIKIEEVNYNESFIQIREYQADFAAIEVVPALLNGPEQVTFLMQVTEYINGSPAGFPFEVQGVFTVPVFY